MTNYFLWLQLVGSLASAIANQNGAAPRELLYLQLLTESLRLGTLTDADLTALHQRITAERASGQPVTDDELAALAERLLDRSVEIQGQRGEGEAGAPDRAGGAS